MTKFLIKAQKFLFLLFFGSIVASLAGVLVFNFVPVPVTPLMMIRTFNSLSEKKFVSIEKDWVPLDEISVEIQQAVLKAEDVRFFEHNGFDYEAIRKAYHYNKKHKESKKGASTISQQTAKNVFLWPSRSWLRKGLETYFTILIENVWSKERILEVYLNVIELGPGVYGVEAASQKYFLRSAKKINKHQASLIAAVLPNPLKYKINQPSRYIISRQKKILRRSSPEIPKKRASYLPSDLNFAVADRK